MNGVLGYIVPPANLQQAVILPDGTQPLPLGSGSIAGLLGTGGMSNVYKIWNPQMETYRAVKLMKPDLSTEARQRFQTEIKIMAALSHPNIIEIHSVGEWNGLSYIEMELIDGATLSEIIERRGALPIPVCTALGILIARALVYAHSKEYVLYGKTYHGLIHRDLKPSNIMISNDAKVKLMDFGIARPVETSLMTMDGAVMGTMQYLAPEQIDGKNVGVVSDIYSLGAIIYEIITGRKAFPQHNLSQLMSAKTGNVFVPLAMFKIRMPSRLKKLSARCMEWDPEKRIRTAPEALAELESVHAALTSDAPEEVVRRFILSSASDARVELDIRRKIPLRRAAFAAAALLAFCAAGTAILLWPRGKAAPESFAPINPAETPLAEKAAVPAKRPLQPLAGPEARRTKNPPAAAVYARAAAKALPAAPAPAAKTAVPPPAPVQQAARLSHTDALRSALGLNDPIEILAHEVQQGKYESAFLVYGELPPPLAASEKAALLRLRVLEKSGKTADVERAVESSFINDGEFYLIKARTLFRLGAVEESLRQLEKSVSVGAQFLDAGAVRQEYLYSRALCLERLFEQAPSEDQRKNALDAWFEVKKILRNNPDHAYFKKAVAEMQKIGMSAAQAKGGQQ